MHRMAGYCALCRAKEIELYGTVLSATDCRHVRACYEAGCGHPAVYRFRNLERPVETTPATGWEAKA